MGYMYIYQNKDCDACGACEQQPIFNCDQCDAPIYEGDLYYEIDNEVYCEECVIDIFGAYA